MFSNKKFISAIAISLLTTFAAGSALAETHWDKEHPRRDEVNHRLKNQDKRINQEVKEGDISKQKAGKLHREDRQIHQEERDMAAQNGGHITKGEQKVLNQQENKTSHQIGQ
jgi:hypothetical protein